MDECLVKRSVLIQKGTVSKGPVVYWMSRDQRVEDNWALIYSSILALENHTSLAVIFCLTSDFLNASIRQYGFMIKGLQECAHRLKKHNIPFYLLQGNPADQIPVFLIKYRIHTLVTDFDPLRIKQKWKQEVAIQAMTDIITVDAHNIVPAFIASNKAEFGAYTLRPKIQKALTYFLQDFPNLLIQKQYNDFEFEEYPWEIIISNLKVDRSVQEVDWCSSGEKAAKVVLTSFLTGSFHDYHQQRNDPNSESTSGLSPYLHFGNISAQRIALTVLTDYSAHISAGPFLEELIIRRELADNYCLYNPRYDTFDGFPGWARMTLNDHRKDEREYLYNSVQFEGAQTHDSLWNAAQMEMKNTGKMHGYMRMYWAKKILEWSASPEDALRIAISLNDKYELDGRDPNGYTGCAWSIGGVHDRAWNSHPVYGKIRYMNFNGCKRKFDVKKYIQKQTSNA
jgi:deoxyribodipyrimidine photo-lyase